MPLLEVRDLKTHFFTEEGVVKAVDGIDFHVDKGEVLGIVGESGSGKSVASLSVLRLIPDPPGRIVAGSRDAVCAFDFRVRMPGRIGRAVCAFTARPRVSGWGGT